MKIEKGNVFICEKNYFMDKGDLAYIRGKIYTSNEDGYLPSEIYQEHRMEINSEFNEHFTRISDKDPINPDHYKSYSVETIDMMVAIYGKEKVAIHCELTAFKYRMRAGKKDSLEQDLKKENWYLNKAKELRNENKV